MKKIIFILTMLLSINGNAFGQDLDMQGYITMGIEFEDPLCNADFGSSVALGDLDGDGFDDLIVVALDTTLYSIH